MMPDNSNIELIRENQISVRKNSRSNKEIITREIWFNPSIKRYSFVLKCGVKELTSQWRYRLPIDAIDAAEKVYKKVL